MYVQPIIRACFALALLAGGGTPVLAHEHTANAVPQRIDNEDIRWQNWLRELRTEALNKGISQATLEAALRDIKPVKRVVELDRSQPEFKLTLSEYLKRVVSPARIKEARAKLNANRALLSRISATYGVQPRFLVALWGIESNFGRTTGGFDVIPALATLAYDGRRSAFFRKQLFHALTIIDEGHVTPEKMRGSWAGAMGQTQFMPSTFTSYAVDFDDDGRRDVWGSRADALASGANYLKRVGWNDNLTWGREVRLPPGFNTDLAGRDKGGKTLATWQKLGVRRLDGRDLPQRDIKASLIIPDDDAQRAFLAYDNYQALLKWNRSNYFVIAVGMIADALKEP